jgi:hypothetical protein
MPRGGTIQIQTMASANHAVIVYSSAIEQETGQLTNAHSNMTKRLEIYVNDALKARIGLNRNGNGHVIISLRREDSESGNASNEVALAASGMECHVDASREFLAWIDECALTVGDIVTVNVVSDGECSLPLHTHVETAEFTSEQRRKYIERLKSEP